MSAYISAFKMQFFFLHFYSEIVELERLCLPEKFIDSAFLSKSEEKYLSIDFYHKISQRSW